MSDTNETKKTAGIERKKRSELTKFLATEASMLEVTLSSFEVKIANLQRNCENDEAKRQQQTGNGDPNEDGSQTSTLDPAQKEQNTLKTETEDNETIVLGEITLRRKH